MILLHRVSPVQPSPASPASQPPKYPTSSRPRNLFEINENQWFWDHFRPADPNLQNLIPWPWPGLPSQPSQPSQPALQHRQPVILATQVQATSYVRSQGTGNQLYGQLRRRQPVIFAAQAQATSYTCRCKQYIGTANMPSLLNAKKYLGSTLV